MILKNEDLTKRYAISPLRAEEIWAFYQLALKQFWIVEEATIADDDFDSLPENEKEYLKNILAFFAISDGLVIDNLATNFYKEADILEVQYYYGSQILIEQIHAEAYSLMIETYIKDLKERNELFNSMETNPAVAKKASWAENWIEHESFVQRLVAFACVEGLSFSSVFAGVFWFRSRNKMKGLGAMNELIIRDESQHYAFAKHLYNNYVREEYKLDEKTLKQIILECYEVEKTFVEESMPNGLPGLTKDMMVTYVQFVTDHILVDFKLEPHFKVNNPLSYMARIGLLSKQNFFEHRTGQYTRIEIEDSSENIFEDDF